VKRTYEQLKGRARERVAEQLRRDIAGHDGSARARSEVQEGLDAARDLGIDVAPFERALASRLKEINTHQSRPGRRRVAG